ncbi:MAG: phenylalanine--tRNA ligase subunit alpha [Candidatus Pacebacteria bacterium]|nr:phenylalanine--tRNA ligase subunit alpha [Candidatus Paceibacterota bacterium]
MLDIEKIKQEAKDALAKIASNEEAQELFRKYLGKNGEVARAFALLKDMAVEERQTVGREVNELKKEIEALLAEKKELLKKELKRLETMGDEIDITRPGIKPVMGHLHPLTLVQRQVAEIFQSMGFEIAQGPEMETEWYNFDALNMPKDHPVREMQDTFWLKGESKMLMRTQTSAVQVHYMEKHTPPLRIIAPGRIFRNEAIDATHECQFYQVEGLMVDKNICAANFKAIIEEFLEKFFQTDVDIRLRPSFFPFTEPSFEIDAKRKGGKWLELMGAGMVNQNVFEAASYPRDKYRGFAFGVGLDRLAMIKYGINEIRLFYQNDLRFLKQF